MHKKKQYYTVLAVNNDGVYQRVKECHRREAK